MDFDPEIAAIFSEEAVELLDAAESALESWNASPHDSSQAAALRRPLHTLKGGARMAGISAMGELSHELESLITRIESGLANGDEGARLLAQQALDELSKMRDAIAESRPAAGAPALIARIQAASGTGSAAAVPAANCPLHRMPTAEMPAIGGARRRSGCGTATVVEQIPVEEPISAEAFAADAAARRSRCPPRRRFSTSAAADDTALFEAPARA